MTFCCQTHRVTVEVDGNRRKFTFASGSWAGFPQCRIMLVKDIKEETVEKCVIKRVN